MRPFVLYYYFCLSNFKFNYMNNLITPRLKDELLMELLSTGYMQVQISSYEEAQKFNCSSDIICAIYNQFEEMGFIEQTKCMGSLIICKINVNAHDFMLRGGFQAQEEILIANLQKLSRELDLLSKQLGPNLSEKASMLSGIVSNILSAISLFKP